MTHSQTTLHPIWDEFPAIRKELQGVLDRIEANLDANDADVEAALIDMFSHGGKLLRPAFTILIGRFFPAEREPLLNQPHLSMTTSSTTHPSDVTPNLFSHDSVRMLLPIRGTISSP